MVCINSGGNLNDIFLIEQSEPETPEPFLSRKILIKPSRWRLSTRSNILLRRKKICTPMEFTGRGLAEVFSSERQGKILAHRSNANRNRTIWAELLARYVVAEISSSHAGNWGVCSVGNFKSGVDVETAERFFFCRANSRK